MAEAEGRRKSIAEGLIIEVGSLSGNLGYLGHLQLFCKFHILPEPTGKRNGENAGDGRETT